MICLLTNAAYTQIDKIDVDRPDQTNAPFVMYKGYLQFEMGISIQTDNSGEKDFSVPNLMVRYGLFKKAELRIATTIDHYPIQLSSNETIHQTGVQPLTIGTKIALAREKKWFPETSLILGLAFPKLASKDLQADKIAPNLTLSMQNTLSKKWSVAYNIGPSWDGYTNRPSWNYSASFGLDLNENWDTFMETYGSFSKDDAPGHNVDAGLGYYANENIKFDVSAGVGISKDGPPWFVGIGGSWRINTRK